MHSQLPRFLVSFFFVDGRAHTCTEKRRWLARFIYRIYKQVKSTQAQQADCRFTVNADSRVHVVDCLLAVIMEDVMMTTWSSIDWDVAQTTNVDLDDESFEATVRLVVPVVFGLVTVLGLVGNLLVIAVAFRQKTRNTTSVLIVGLAIADLVFIVVCVPFTATIYVLPAWPFGVPFCKVSYFEFSV